MGGGEESGWHTALPNRDKIIFVRVGGTRSISIRHGGRAHISSHMEKCYYPLGKRGVNNCSQRNSIGCRLDLRSGVAWEGNRRHELNLSTCQRPFSTWSRHVSVLFLSLSVVLDPRSIMQQAATCIRFVFLENNGDLSETTLL